MTIPTAIWSAGGWSCGNCWEKDIYLGKLHYITSLTWNLRPFGGDSANPNRDSKVQSQWGHYIFTQIIAWFRLHGACYTALNTSGVSSFSVPGGQLKPAKSEHIASWSDGYKHIYIYTYRIITTYKYKYKYKCMYIIYIYMYIMCTYIYIYIHTVYIHMSALIYPII